MECYGRGNRFTKLQTTSRSLQLATLDVEHCTKVK